MSNITRKPVQSLDEVKLGLYEIYTMLLDTIIDTGAGSSVAIKNINSISKTIIEIEKGLDIDKRIEQLAQEMREINENYKTREVM